MIQLNPGSLIYYIPYHPGDGTNLIRYGTEFTEVKWIKRNEIGLFVKISPDLASRAICLFGEELFTVPITSIKPWTTQSLELDVSTRYLPSCEGLISSPHL